MQQQAQITKMLEELAALGIELKKGYSIEDLSFYDGDEITYELLLQELGSDFPTARGTFEPMSAQIWRLDTMCIFESGDYTTLAKRLLELSGGALALTAMEDEVDEGAGTAVFAYRLAGERHELQLKVEEELVDEAFFIAFDRMLQEANPDLSYYFYNPDGQELLVCCGSSQFIQQLQKLTGIPFVRQMA